jgi:hypothetical protein
VHAATRPTAPASVDQSGYRLDFVDEIGQRRQEALGACWNVAFETVQPVRAFRWSKVQRHWPGWWWSSTSGRHIGYESWLEREHAMLLDFDPDVTGFESQPFWLHWTGDQRERRHAPDFFARLSDGTGVVVDVRADDRIVPADAEAFEAMAAACATVGWQFRRVGAPDPILVANVRWLSRYRHPRCGARQEVAEQLISVFARPVPLFEGAAEVGDRLAVLPVLYHLMWRQDLVAELAQGPLGAHTMIQRGADVEGAQRW